MIPKTLTTKAADNFGFHYEVALIPSDFKGFEGEYILKIKGTPGSWYMSTLEGFNNPVLSIDMGQKWDCTNFSAVLTEARSLLTDEDRAVMAANRAKEKTLWNKVAA